jgi:hypothetical protein
MNMRQQTHVSYVSAEKIPAGEFVAVYRGVSMNPTLREPDMLEIVPYEDRPIRAGDVVFFAPPGEKYMVVHRVIRIGERGIQTRGDRHASEDRYLLQTEDIKGRVVAAWRGQKRRTVAGGWRGSARSWWLQYRRGLDKTVFVLIRFCYRTMAGPGLMIHFVPRCFRPRIVVFHVRGKDEFRLVMGQRSIGRYDDTLEKWRIERPFLLFVNQRALEKEGAGGEEFNEVPPGTSLI